MVLVAVVLTAYMLLLVALAVAAPGIGLAGALIAFIPGGWQDQAHIPAYGLLGWLAIQAFRLRGWPLSYALLCGTLLAMVFGLWTEVAQGSAPGRDPSMHDLINDAMGGMMAVTLIVGQRILASHITGRDSSVANVPAAEGVPLK
jgi:hypothetical protein